jgi:hypothetical protein
MASAAPPTHTVYRRDCESGKSFLRAFIQKKNMRVLEPDVMGHARQVAGQVAQDCMYECLRMSVREAQLTVTQRALAGRLCIPQAKGTLPETRILREQAVNFAVVMLTEKSNPFHQTALKLFKQVYQDPSGEHDLVQSFVKGWKPQTLTTGAA